MKKTCETCKFESIDILFEPCVNCSHDKWESKEGNAVIPTKLINTDDPQFLPFRKHPNDAGGDLRARIERNIALSPGDMVKIPAGVGVEIPDSHVGFVIARSGATTDGKVTLIGAVDAGYRGEIGMNVINLSKKFTTIVPGERLAQLIIVPCLIAEFILKDELPESDRGTNGFGSSGKM